MASSQTAGDDAASLIREASEAARSARTWHAEGRNVTTLEGERLHSTVEAPLTIDYRTPAGGSDNRTPASSGTSEPAQARTEITGGPKPVLRLCDGAIQWLYDPAAKRYSRRESAQASPCAYPIGEWPSLSRALQSPVLAGSDTLEFEGSSRQCQVVRGNFALQRPSAYAEDTRTLCIDPATKLILRYRIDRTSPGGVHETQTYTFTSLRRDIDLPPDLFAFHPPEGSAEAPFAGVFSTDTTRPSVISTVPPEYTEEARVAQLEGDVLLYVEVSPEGIPHNIKVIRGLGKGLDEKAVEAVGRWRFRPGTKDGKPVTVSAQVQVSFRLLKRK